MVDRQPIPGDVAGAIDVWLAHHDRLAPGLIEGLYIVGSISVGDYQAVSDIDIVAFTADPADEQTVAILEAAHDATRSDLPDVTIDGPRLAWADVSVPPMPALRPWTLDGEFRFDGECFVINPVTWYELDRYGIAVRGGPAADLGVHVDVAEMRTFVRESVDTYWRSVGASIRAALAEPDRRTFAAGPGVWAALGAARMLYTTVTGDVTSKTAAGEWAIGEVPVHTEALRAAIESRRTGQTEPLDRPTVEAIADLVDDVVARIAGSA